MIARIWRGTALSANAGAYHHHFTKNVAPHLTEIAGYRGAYLLRRDEGGEVEFLAVTLWDSMETIKGFTGPDPTVAVVEPEAQGALADFDNFATHYEVVFSSVGD